MNHEIHFKSEKNHWWFKSRRAILRNILDIIGDSNQRSLLEVGCGTGGNLRFLFNNFQKLAGLDIDEGAIKLARQESSEITYIQGDANYLDNLQSNYDIIAFLDVLYHKNIKKVSDVIKQAYDKLNPNGYLLISEPAFNILKGQHSKNVKSKRRFKIKDFNSMIINSGFKEIKFASYWGMVLFVIIFLKRRILDHILGEKILSEGTDIIQIPIIDDLLYKVTTAEMLLMRGRKIPFGSSVVILARK